MKQVPLSSLSVSRMAYGCWRIAGTWSPAEVTPASQAAGRKAVLAAYEAGFTLFDQADIYCHGESEKILGQVLKEVSGMRERVVIATKCGIRMAGEPKPDAPYRYDFSADYITRCCEQSLKRLGIETIDLYQLHRPDYLMDPQEIAGAFEQLKRSGKVREFGVSNFRPSQVTALIEWVIDSSFHSPTPVRGAGDTRETYFASPSMNASPETAADPACVQHGWPLGRTLA